MKIFYQYGHLLIQIQMYLSDHDIYTQQFSKNIKKVLVKRQKQFQRLFSSCIPQLGNSRSTSRRQAG